MSDAEPTLGSSMETAIYAAAQAAGTMVTKYILVAQTVTPEGEPDLWVCTPDEITPWDELGLLTYATALTKASINLDEEEEE